MISKYNEFLLEKKFQSILDDIYKIVESEGRWIDDNTIEWDVAPREYEWDLTNDIKKPSLVDKTVSKIKDLISNLPKEKIKEYFIKLLNKLKPLPGKLRKFLITHYTSAFLTVVTLGYLVSPGTEAPSSDGISKTSMVKTEQLDKDIRDEVLKVNNKESNKASFEKAQGLVKLAEAGYSDDRGDNGNYIDVPGGKRFIGTNHGISAPILDNYFKSQGIKRLLTKDDMINLSYKTALEIYKADYWNAQHLGELTDQNVANVIYDGCVNQGTDAMRSIVRNALEANGVDISDNDVIFSKEVLSKANKLNQVKLFNSIKKFRESRYKESDTFNRHGDGWLNRLDNISYEPQETSSDRV
jgi:lysozyme family protein